MKAKKEKCTQATKQKIEMAIKDLPPNQQTAVRMCFMAAKDEKGNGNRFVHKWILQCILLRIKSRETYENLRNRKILALRCINTLSTYIRKIKGSFGFQDSVFKLLRTKIFNMTPRERHGKEFEMISCLNVLII